MKPEKSSAERVGASDPEEVMEVQEMSLELLMRYPEDGPVPKDPDRVERNIRDLFMHVRDKRKFKGIQPLTKEKLVAETSFVFFHSVSSAAFSACSVSIL